MKHSKANTPSRTTEDAQPRAVLYARTGGRPQILDLAEVQLAQCRRTAHQHGCTIVGEYTDHARPPRLDRLTKLQELLNDLSRLQATHIITFDARRLPAPAIQRIEDAGAALLLVDGSTPAPLLLAEGPGPVRRIQL